MVLPIPIRPGTSKGRRCRIMNIGPDSEVRHMLTEFVQADELVSIDYIETGSIALDMLSILPESELPQMVIVPFHLPFLTGLDFITAMRSHEALQAIPIFVWGPHIRSDEIKKMYKAGAACVFLGQFSAVHLEALRQFCGKWTGAEDDVPMAYAIASALRHSGEKAGRNARLGTVFVWAGCLSTILWICAFLGTRYMEGNFAALSVYAALTSAGLSLIRLGRA